MCVREKFFPRREEMYTRKKNRTMTGKNTVSRKRIKKKHFYRIAIQYYRLLKRKETACTEINGTYDFF